MQRNVTPEEFAAITRLAAENPDLCALEVELGQLRALAAAQAGRAAPLRPASFREVLKGVEAGILSRSEARAFCGLPASRNPLERVLEVLRWPLHLVVLGSSGSRAASKRAA